jgi:hypothetical protein
VERLLKKVAYPNTRTDGYERTDKVDDGTASTCATVFNLERSIGYLTVFLQVHCWTSGDN